MVTMEQAEMLMSSGIDYIEALDRFDNNEALYKRLALKFFNDRHYTTLVQALASNDVEVAYHEAHSLKGVAGNLSFSELHHAAARVSDALFLGDTAAARSCMPAVRAAYDNVITALAMLR